MIFFLFWVGNNIYDSQEGLLYTKNNEKEIRDSFFIQYVCFFLCCISATQIKTDKP